MATITAARVDLAADRWTLFFANIYLFALDLTSASMAMEIRTIPDATGVPLVSLVNAAAGAQGLRVVAVYNTTIAVHIENDRLDSVPPGYSSTDIVPVTLVTIRVNETTMEGLPFPAERGDDLTLSYDMHITPSGGLKQRYLYGKFIVQAGVTQ